MSACVIKQTSECTKREFEKISGIHAKLPQAHKKVCDETKVERKNDYRVKIFVVKGRIYNAVSEDWPNRFQ